jgi:hypothetical protein
MTTPSYAALFRIARTVLVLIPALTVLAPTGPSSAAQRPAAGQSGCLHCHAGIEDIAPSKSPMMVQIRMVGQLRGDPAGCVVCHGGDPKADNVQAAHQGAPKVSKHCHCPTPEAFYPDPGDLDVAEHTCGQCHRGYTQRLHRSLMATEAGKIAATLKAWEVQSEPPAGTAWGNFAVRDTDGLEPSVGTDEYKAYMKALIAEHPDRFPLRLSALPNPDVDVLKADPALAPMARFRARCGGCHLRSTGRGRSGEHRGLGCSACHVPYAEDGRYAGEDPTIDRDTPGHPLTHTIQGTRKTHIHYGHTDRTGIPARTCNGCHNRADTYHQAAGKARPSPRIADDVHHAGPDGPPGGLLCQDCHTSNEVHGDGNIAATIGAQTEVRCADCHGTGSAYPWELPLGYGDPLRPQWSDKPRGLAQQLQKVTSWWATRYPRADGYLKTSRGNPFGNVVKDGDRVILHSATGKDFVVPLFKGKPAPNQP